MRASTTAMTPGEIVTSPKVLAILIPLLLLMVPLVMLISGRSRRTQH